MTTTPPSIPVRPADRRPSVVVDPRLRERRIAVRRAEGRKRLHRIMAFFGVSTVVLGTMAVIQSPLLDVDHLAVTGTTRTPPDDILAAAGIARGDTMFTIDLGAATEAVEALPWVLEATITREYPGEIAIEVTERTAVAVIEGKGPDGAPQAVLVDLTGRVLGPVGAEAAAGMVTVGEETTGATGLLPIEVTATPPAPGERIADDLDGALELAVSAGEVTKGKAQRIVVEPELTVVLAGGGQAVLGAADDPADPAGRRGGTLADKLDALRTVVARVDLTCLDTIDLRVPTNPVLTRRGTGRGCR